MENVIIRIAKLSDFEKVLLLSDELTLSDLPYDLQVDKNWSHTAIGKIFYKSKINQTKGICFVADLNGEIIGYAVCSKREVASYRKVKVADLENIYVSQEFRNKGVGKMLIEAFKNWAKSQNFDKVSVNVFAGNEKGINFYKREGFLPQDLNLEMQLK